MPLQFQKRILDMGNHLVERPEDIQVKGLAEGLGLSFSGFFFLLLEPEAWGGMGIMGDARPASRVASNAQGPWRTTDREFGSKLEVGADLEVSPSKVVA